MQQTISVPSQLTFRISSDTQNRFAKFHDQHPFIPLTRVLERALSFYLDYAEQGVDGQLTPIKKPKL